VIDVVAVRPPTSAVRQWWVLTLRVIRPSFRNGEAATQVAASILFICGFYIPLKEIMGGLSNGTSSYAQYLMPLVALQGTAFVAGISALRSATDSKQGINRRFKALPIGPLTPFAARMSASIYRCGIALTVALVAGYIIGFRIYGGALHALGFCLMVLLIGAAFSFLGDFIGAATENPEQVAPLILLPNVIFGLLSVGVQPIDQFPDWIEPFVRNQPVSQFVYALRALAGDKDGYPAAGDVSWDTVGPAIIWVVVLISVLIPLHALIARKRRDK